MQEPKLAGKNTPYWWEAAPVTPLPPQPLAKKLDVAVVGAGYSGLSAGLVLAREGRSVAAFDGMNPGEGASSRNGGITSGTIRPDYATNARRFGEDKAMGSITPGDADAWFLWLKERYANGTVGRSVRRAQQFFRAAVRSRIALRPNAFASGGMPRR